MTNEEFDHIIHVKLKGFSAEVPEDLWERIAVPTTEIADNSFDEFLQDQFSQYKAPVSPDLFDRIIPEEKKRRIFFMLPKISMVAASLMLIVLISSVSAFLYFNQIAFDNNQPNNAITNSNLATPPPPSNKPTISIEEDHKELNNLNAANNIQVSNESVEEKQNTSILKEEKLNNKADFAFRKSHLPLQSHVIINSVNANAPINSNKNTKSGSGEEHYDTYQPFIKLNAQTINIENKTTPIQSGDKEINFLFNHSRNIRNVVICPSDKKMRNTNWDIEVFASPTDVTFKTVTNNSATQDFLNRKDSSEKMKIGYSAGFRIVKPLSDNFSIKTGLQYTQANEQFTYRTENEIKTTTVITVRNITLANGSIVTVSDTSILQQIGYKTNSVNNSYKTIDVPVLLGYEFGNEDWRFGINTGVLFNITTWNKGVTLDSSLLPQSFSKESNLIYKNNIGLGLYAGFSFTKRINYNTLVFAEPYIRYNLSNMTTASSTFNQRFTVGGLALGVRFNLNNR